MNENGESKRKQFIAKFATQVEGIRSEKLKEDYNSKKTSIGEMVDGYMKYILDLGEGFIQFAEAYNQCIEIAKYNEILGEAKLKVRIKDFSSSYSNTERKALDDVFGMQVATDTEGNKEFFILFNYLIFKMLKCKKYDKSNGYVAYHHLGDYSPKNTGDIKKTIIDIVANEKAKEYKSSQNTSKEYHNVFKKLPSEILKSNKFNRMVETLQEMLELIQLIDLEPSQIPIIEFHIMTIEAEEEAIRGTASHDKYKNGQDEIIRKFFNEGKLIRGINSPWKFESGKSGLVLQDFYTTLIENWPFLKDDIVERRRIGKEQEDIEKVKKYDTLLASQFPFLREYLKKKPDYNDGKQAERWGLLKAIIIANGLDFNNHEKIEPGSVGDVVANCLDEIW
jgi:hypothetical protein